MILESDSISRLQSAEEAIEVLRRAGFGVEDISIEVEGQDAAFDLNLTLTVSQDERPLEHVE